MMGGGLRPGLGGAAGSRSMIILRLVRPEVAINCFSSSIMYLYVTRG